MVNEEKKKVSDGRGSFIPFVVNGLWGRGIVQVVTPKRGVCRGLTVDMCDEIIAPHSLCQGRNYLKRAI